MIPSDDIDCVRVVDLNFSSIIITFNEYSRIRTSIENDPQSIISPKNKYLVFEGFPPI